MCGIAGIINASGVNVQQIVRMTDIINHRGPDDEGFVVWKNINDQFVVYGGKDTPETVYHEDDLSYLPVKPIESIKDTKAVILFGHRRLSILDLSPAGHQPMSYLNDRYWIVLNGEIYNYIELREELKSIGYTFVSNCDTEVVLAAFHEWGTDCQYKFNGMWAFVIYDSENKEFFFSRDRFGIKPLYYWFSPEGNFCFASEIKQFTVLDDWTAKLNHQRAYEYLIYALTDHSEETMFKGVNQIQSGHCIKITIDQLAKNGDKLATKRWYDIAYKGYTGSFEDAKVEFLNLFKSAIELHLRSDVPVGSALSGGLDSSSIVSYVNILLKKEHKADLQKTFSSCSTDERFDEKKWMDEVVKHTNVDAHFIYPQGENVFKMTEKLIWHHDEPYQSQAIFLAYHVFESSKQNNSTVLLNGQGADEYLSCYGFYRQFRLRKLLFNLNLKQLMHEFKGQPYSEKVSEVFKLIFNGNNLPKSVKDIFRRYNPATKDILNTIDTRFRKNVSLNEMPRGRFDSIFEISKHQLNHNPLPRYLKWEDRNSMAHSVEARVPFLDYRLVEFTMNLPVDYLDAKDESKKIMVSALKGILPEKVRKRKDKKGFITPEERWFTEDYKKEFIDLFLEYANYSNGIIDKENAVKFLLDVQNKKIPFSYDYWRLISFGIWMKVFQVEK